MLEDGKEVKGGDDGAQRQLSWEGVVEAIDSKADDIQFVMDGAELKERRANWVENYFKMKNIDRKTNLKWKKRKLI